MHALLWYYNAFFSSATIGVNTIFLEVLATRVVSHTTNLVAIYNKSVQPTMICLHASPYSREQVYQNSMFILHHQEHHLAVLK